jgi:hypothetical protein
MAQDSTVEGVRRALADAWGFHELTNQARNAPKFAEVGQGMALKHHLALERLIDMVEEMDQRLATAEQKIHDLQSRGLRGR